MKKIMSFLLVLSIFGLLTFFGVVHQAISAEKDKYGGILKWNNSKT